jgi:hypothetical protein
MIFYPGLTSVRRLVLEVRATQKHYVLSSRHYKTSMLNSFPLVLYQVPVSTGKRIGTSPLLEYLRTVGLKLRYVLLVCMQLRLIMDNGLFRTYSQYSTGTLRILSILRPKLLEKSTSGTGSGRNQNVRITVRSILGKPLCFLLYAWLFKYKP